MFALSPTPAVPAGDMPAERGRTPGCCYRSHMNATAEKIEPLLLTSAEDIQHASRALKAMAHPLRLQILCLLGRTREASVQDIVDHVGTSQSNISQHLSILREKNIVATRKDANKVYYRIGDSKILSLIDSLHPAFCDRRG